jgi:hypothetical protein
MSAAEARAHIVMCEVQRSPTCAEDAGIFKHQPRAPDFHAGMVDLQRVSNPNLHAASKKGDQMENTEERKESDVERRRVHEGAAAAASSFSSSSADGSLVPLVLSFSEALAQAMLLRAGALALLPLASSEVESASSSSSAGSSSSVPHDFGAEMQVGPSGQFPPGLAALQHIRQRNGLRWQFREAREVSSARRKFHHDQARAVIEQLLCHGASISLLAAMYECDDKTTITAVAAIGSTARVSPSSLHVPSSVAAPDVLPSDPASVERSHVIGAASLFLPRMRAGITSLSSHPCCAVLPAPFGAVVAHLRSVQCALFLPHLDAFLIPDLAELVLQYL